MDSFAHNQRIVDQFSRQAAPFSEKPTATQEESLRIMLTLTEASAADEVLDVACGPGIVACAFAAVARHVTGIDLTPAMLERARALQRQRGLANLTWQEGDVASLPFPEDHFSIVLTRYSFHHFLAPANVLAEMVRVCRPGGRVLVVDVTPDSEKADAFDRVETLRDPSHVHAFPSRALEALIVGAGLADGKRAVYQVEMALERQLATSFPNPGDADRIRELVRLDLGHDRLGLAAHRRGEDIYVAYPVTAFVASKPAPGDS